MWKNWKPSWKKLFHACYDSLKIQLGLYRISYWSHKSEGQKSSFLQIIPFNHFHFTWNDVSCRKTQKPSWTKLFYACYDSLKIHLGLCRICYWPHKSEGQENLFLNIKSFITYISPGMILYVEKLKALRKKLFFACYDSLKIHLGLCRISYWSHKSEGQRRSFLQIKPSNHSHYI